MENGFSCSETDDEEGVKLDSQRSTEKSLLASGGELCKTCKCLDLTVDKFIIRDDALEQTTRFADSHRSSADLGHASSFSPKSRNRREALGSLDDIQRRGDRCPFCYLVIKSIRTTQTGTRATDPPERKMQCYINWELDGRRSTRSGQLLPCTRRIRLRWEPEESDDPKYIHRQSKGLEDSHLVFVAPDKYFQFNSDADHSWEREAFFLGRKIMTEGNTQAYMRSWLETCRNQHKECVDREDQEFGKMIQQSFFGVIDVGDLRLTKLPFHADDDGHIIHEPYVALSYVWGVVQGDEGPYKTTLMNVMRHQRHAGLDRSLEKLPRVIKDAMDLVRRLGYRYLWIDSLCIVQDSKRSWKLNANVMNLIYGNAVVTICAADGEDSSTPLKAMYPNEHSIAQYKQKCSDKVHLMVTHLAETGIRASTWDTRAWTFQERLLSKRCLIFTEGRVFFQCRSSTISEDIVAVPQGTKWSLELVKSPPQILRELNRRPFWVYARCVSLYSSRRLSKPGDILAAFNGVSNLIGKTMEAPFIFGLPSSHFDLALLWQPFYSPERRQSKASEGGKERQEMEFPSWSWCGWMDAEMGYKSDFIEDCMANVHEWLMEHTWISWYIRDGRGNLRPMWDGYESKEARNTEQRWWGYQPYQLDFIRSRHKDRKESKKRRKEEERLRKEAEERHERDLPRFTHERRRGYEAGYREDIHEERGGHEGGHDVITDRGREYPSGNEIIIRRERPVVFYNPGNESGTSDESEAGEDDLYYEYGRDDYGRMLRPEVLGKSRKEFEQTLPESPYRVVKAKYSPRVDKEFPDQPILQFWTWSISLRIARSENPYKNLGEGLCRYDITDNIGDWCGSIVLDEKWIEAKKAKPGFEGSKHEFIAISDAKEFNDDECNVWTYYIPKEKDQSEWDLYYVLLVESAPKPSYRELSQRVALGKAFKAAFENGTPGQKWKEIMLG